MSFRRSELPACVLAAIDASDAEQPTSPPARTVIIDQPEHQRTMNKTEGLYAEELAKLRACGAILSFHYELFRLRLAHSTFYIPDFLVVRAAPPILQFHEVKGFMRDDAAVKVKAAAQLYPEFRFVIVRRLKGGRWRLQEVKRWQNNQQIGSSPASPSAPTARKKTPSRSESRSR